MSRRQSILESKYKKYQKCPQAPSQFLTDYIHLPTMQAIQLEAKGGPAVFVKDRPLPKLPKDCLLVKTVAVGLNPHELVDIYPPYTISSPGDLLGCDYSGIVLEVGSEVTRPFKKGDRVCGCTRPNPLQPDWGTFAEFIVVVGDVQLRIPEGMGFEDAASLGVTVLTSGAVLVCVF